MGGDKIEKITIMVLKVDLQCSSCYKKVKKVLCKFPQIRDQVYDEKANSVTIKVFCCNPEKIRDKLCCEGGGVITSIEIIVPKTHKETPSNPKETPSNPKTPEKTEKPPPTPAPAPVAPQPQFSPLIIMQIQGYPPQTPPRGNCCDECCQGHSGGPCYHHARPIPPPPSASCYYFCEENASGCSIM